jgi:hypothetical protein
MLEALDRGHDVVIASRYRRGSRMPVSRRTVSCSVWVRHRC